MSTARVRVSVGQQQSVTPLWCANHETHDFSQWQGVWNNGDATNVISSTQAHSGQYSAKLTIDTSVSTAGTRLTEQGRWGPGGTLPATAYYSVWYWFPQQIRVSGQFFNIFQWKQARTSNDGDRLGSDPVYVFNINNRQNGSMFLVLSSHVGDDGGLNTPGRGKIAFSPIDLPVQQWVHLESLYTWARDSTGEIRTWQNGVEIWHETNRITEFDEQEYINTFTFKKFPRAWTVNNYSNGTDPAAHSHYVDDAVIASQRVYGKTVIGL